ncbi:MAG: glycosyltransferase family 2 protein [Bacteroidota bacterium]|nr:glycosyltransferase family 2 protein [Bacteroidota bacterium]
MQPTITAIILTFNEEQHIERCIRSLSGIVDQVFVIDSYSHDKTTEIAEALGVKVLQNKFVNQAVQFNWALDHCDIAGDWIIRIDADEYVENPRTIDVKEYLSQLPADITGLHIDRKIVFMGKPLLHGGWYPKKNLRVFRTGIGRSEERWMDEHIVLSSGTCGDLPIDFVDENLNNLTWWIQKHNLYANREVVDFYLTKFQMQNDHEVLPKLFGSEAERKRWLKEKYMNFPFFLRPLINFIYRYIILRGFLDGKQGLMWHFLQGFWYRFLVDAKIYELEKKMGGDQERIVEYIRGRYRI